MEAAVGASEVATDLLETLVEAANAVAAALSSQRDWGPTDGVPGQYHHDTVADAAALKVLLPAGLGVLSEESGLHHPERPVLVVLDPVDGSTNASRGLPWWGVSLCALDSDGLLASVVSGPRIGQFFSALRGEGAWLDGRAISPSAASSVRGSLLVFNGYPPSYLGWAQFRAFGAAALELCGVACGEFDGFVDWSRGSLKPWDYLGGVLVCQEAGACVADAWGRDLVVRRRGERRAVVAAGTEALLSELVEARTASAWKMG